MNINNKEMLNTSSNQSQSVQSCVETCNVLNGVENLSNVCRTCANVTEFVIPIFVGEGLHNNLAHKIQQHLPIKISEDDCLPHVVCYQCASTILAWHDLVECCLQADASLRQLQITSHNNETKLRTKPDQIVEDNEESPSIKNDSDPLTFVYDILHKYLKVMEVDESNADLDYVCQACVDKPAAKTIDNLVQHLQMSHSSEFSDCESTQNFIRNNITFEEALNAEDREEDTNNIDKRATNKTGVKLPTFFCPYCDSAFSTPTRLIHHINRHVDISAESALSCCGETFDKKSFAFHVQRRHVTRVVTGPHACRSCSHVAPTPAQLHAHVAAEHGGRDAGPRPPRRRTHAPAACPQCHKTFSNKHNMQVHLRSHGAAEAFACDKCDRRYRTRGGLSEHRRTAHEGVMRHVCAACGEAFPTRAARDVHARLHTGARPFACDYCGKAYRAKNTLDRHVDGHLDVRKHCCRVCHKRFRRSSHLARHARVHDRDAQ